ncbi:hypothetical protein AFCDBAGC_2001 [Methylobacterium cerastii]|uniref:DUF2946 domain-containing protein n=1 Tax=Methylobacterium cerastii TaxID=932741 RepID=A0ABQ4QGV8_9HYPH|nr:MULTISPECIES: hypothetical protein [Methylobacterium]TXM65720.1 hypothetical protein FV226_24540 [Methylobacterium sp. WL12]TXN81570.1 hypothetical protein FV234_13030 [Methylobacterium sp. WL8]GJD44137.1 hypothetical protein AFCDBAGC_2001 [Methylobacterium cerastii]
MKPSSALHARPTWRETVGTALILLAIWAQSIVPLAALRIAAEPASPGLSAICGHALDAPAAEEPALPTPGCDACPLCAAGLAAPAVPAPQPAARILRWSPVAWPTPPPARTAHRPPLAGRPRAPPTPL